MHRLIGLIRYQELLWDLERISDMDIIYDDAEEIVRRNWKNFISRYTCNNTERFHAGNSWEEFGFQLICSQYNLSSRKYHNLEHISVVLQVVREILKWSLDKNLIKDPNSLYLLEAACVLHDVIYDTHSKTNEKDSAWFSINLLALYEAGADSVAVEEIIVATEHKKDFKVGCEDIFPGIEFLCDVIRDADLFILAESEERYDEYAKQIRQEYLWVSQMMYDAGRMAILNGLAAGQIYRTDFAKEQGWEEKALNNIKRELGFKK